MNYKEIIDILEDEPSTFDFFSVIFGYRNIGLFSLYTDFIFDDNLIKGDKILLNIDDFIKNENILKYPKYIEFIKKIQNFLNENYQEYEFKYGFNGLFFLYKKNNESKIIKVLKKYNNPIDSIDGGRELGILLNYPLCCVDQFYKEKIKSEFTTKLILDKKYFNIPFAPCKIECGEKWLKFYDEIKEKFKEE